MLAIMGSITGLALSIWAIRSIIYKSIAERSVGKSAIQKVEDARKKLEEKADDTELRIKKLELEMDALKDRMKRAEKHVDGNYEDMRQLDEKVEKLRRVQDQKIL